MKYAYKTKSLGQKIGEKMNKTQKRNEMNVFRGISVFQVGSFPVASKKVKNG